MTSAQGPHSPRSECSGDQQWRWKPALPLEPPRPEQDSRPFRKDSPPCSSEWHPAGKAAHTATSRQQDREATLPPGSRTQSAPTPGHQHWVILGFHSAANFAEQNPRQLPAR